MTTQHDESWNDTFAGSLNEFMRRSHGDSFRERMHHFQQYIDNINAPDKRTYFRLVESGSDRMVRIRDEATGQLRDVLMFGSNNYLGLADHPKVKEKVVRCLYRYGAGIAGPPILNGYHKLMRELEERLSDLKKKEDTLIFSSGFSTNLGLINALCTRKDVIVYDNYSHASFKDGLKMFNGQKRSFRHNDVQNLEHILDQLDLQADQTLFLGFEGIYSMDGDICPLPELLPIARKHSAILLLDDAHGTGVLGANGGGTGEHFHCENDIDVVMGTFSKCFSVTGGFVSAEREIVNYLRYNANPYLFSAALPPVVLAAVLGGLDVLEEEAWRREWLLELTAYAHGKLAPFGLVTPPAGAIIALKKPEHLNIRAANRALLQKGVFVNAVEYPAVPQHEERFRISLSASHQREDIDFLADCLTEVFANESLQIPVS